jgi:hypothetical protein
LTSSARTSCAKSGPGRKLDLAAAGRLVLDEDRRAGDVGRHHIGRELDAAEAEAGRGRERPDEERLAEAGDAFEEEMPVGEERDEREVDDLALSDERLADFRPEPGEDLAERLAASADLLDAVEACLVEVALVLREWRARSAATAAALSCVVARTGIIARARRFARKRRAARLFRRSSADAPPGSRPSPSRWPRPPHGHASAARRRRLPGTAVRTSMPGPRSSVSRMASPAPPTPAPAGARGALFDRAFFHASTVPSPILRVASAPRPRARALPIDGDAANGDVEEEEHRSEDRHEVPARGACSSARAGLRAGMRRSTAWRP